MTDSLISWGEWEEKYKPTTDVMYDFYEDIGVGVDSPSPYHIWTVVDNNPNSRYLDVIPGHRVFNRLGFYVTEVPWRDDKMVVSNDPSYKTN
jgi:hypothetical protein